jgi:hypothetical protein
MPNAQNANANNQGRNIAPFTNLFGDIELLPSIQNALPIINGQMLFLQVRLHQTTKSRKNYTSKFDSIINSWKYVFKMLKLFSIKTLA